MQTKGASAELEEIERRLDPRFARDQALADLNNLFRSGSVPHPQPDGFLPGSIVATGVARPVDTFARWLKGLYMPWLGKSFEPGHERGTNVLKASARSQLKVLWRDYEPRDAPGGTIEAFPFKTRIAPGAVDPDVDVLKIDYDLETNPSFIVRRVLDELVQIDDDVYLGKILYRMRNVWSVIGFFSLGSGARS